MTRPPRETISASPRILLRVAVYSHERTARLLRREGYSDELISEVLGQVPDPIDLERDQEILARYGLSTERLMDLLGASP